jgi:hypothetical protein
MNVNGNRSVNGKWEPKSGLGVARPGGPGESGIHGRFSMRCGVCLPGAAAGAMAGKLVIAARTKATIRSHTATSGHCSPAARLHLLVPRETSERRTIPGRDE